MSKVKNLAILGVGYVLGTKAGRARYETLKQQATRVAEHPRTQQLARSAREQVTSRVPTAVTERLPHSVTSRLGTTQSGSSVDSAQSTRSSHDIDVDTAATFNRAAITDAPVEATTHPNRPDSDV